MCCSSTSRHPFNTPCLISSAHSGQPIGIHCAQPIGACWIFSQTPGQFDSSVEAADATAGMSYVCDMWLLEKAPIDFSTKPDTLTIPFIHQQREKRIKARVEARIEELNSLPTDLDPGNDVNSYCDIFRNEEEGTHWTEAIEAGGVAEKDASRYYKSHEEKCR